MLTNERAAHAALDRARPALIRLAGESGTEDRAADLVELWDDTQSAMRALIGGSPLAGQALIHELRNRGLLSLDQAHALVSFAAVRERAERADYVPTTGDVDAARAAVMQLEAALATGTAPDAGHHTSGGPASHAPPATGPVSDPVAADAPAKSREVRRASTLGPVLAIAFIILVAAGFAWWVLGRGGSGLERGIAAYQRGDRLSARAAFAEAARDKPSEALPHVYLGRIAREEGDATTAARELEMAIRLEPGNALAQREMAAHLLAIGNYDLARRFYIRAIELDPTDRNAQGFLGCTMIRLGRVPEGMRFLQRAGQGSWSSCAMPPPMPAAPVQ
ncbi:MAG TPA: tetratricopeptide repeat protein [Gemmatimonadaceae bacterium]|nr:tetratricopeptide repeat protein [Gemmatimonadaceae bacterium]